jgi:hypothetical protein
MFHYFKVIKKEPLCDICKQQLKHQKVTLKI